MATQYDIENRFTFHPAKSPTEAELYEQIRYGVKQIALFINNNVPETREMSLSLTHLEEAVFWANAAIARHWPDENAH